MITEDKFTRFKDADWFDSNKPIHVQIAGAGGIGSWTALFLSRAGIHCHVYDFDTLENVNLAGQAFSHKDIGLPKVEALQNTIATLTDSKIFANNTKILSETMVFPYTVAAFDNMAARKLLFEKWASHPNRKEDWIFVDGRLTAEHFQVFTATSNQDSIDNYRKTLFDDSEVEDLPCTMKQTSHTAAMIGSVITMIITNHIANLFTDISVRTVPESFEWTNVLLKSY